DAGSHSNLGAILHLNRKLSEAEASYTESIRLQPEDNTARQNLRKLQALKSTNTATALRHTNRLEEAEEFYRRAAKLRPLAIHDQMTTEELQFYFGSTSPGVPEYEVILWPATFREIVHLRAFGRHLELKLVPNENLLSANFQFNIISDEGSVTDAQYPLECHYIFTNESVTAAVSYCPGILVRGFIFLSDDTWEVLPLNNRLEALLDSNYDSNWGRHIVKRVSLPQDAFDDVIREDLPDLSQESFMPLSSPMANLFRFHRGKRARGSFRSTDFNSEQFRYRSALNSGPFRYRSADAIRSYPFRYGSAFRSYPFRYRSAGESNPTLETALFLDEPGYILFSLYFNNDDQKLRDMLLAYVNAVQALYHHTSTGQYLDIVLVRLDIFKKQPMDLPHYGGDRSRLLDSFCSYAAKHNPASDENPDHWDISLYVSGLDFYAIENGMHSGATMGLATVGGVCTEKYSCIIAELGTTNEYGNPYPSSGFTAIYILAHEIGHNLGMHHDGSSNYCPKEGFIMSPSRGTSGEVSWSSCSSQVLQTLQTKDCLLDKPRKMSSTMNHSKFNEHPGKVWGAKKQCEVLLRDTEAEVWSVENGESICTILRCHNKKNPGKLYVSGPALDGTECALGRSKFNEHPGKVWGAKKQCEVLLRDTEAEVWSVENGESICTILRCHNKKNPGKLYVSGPALDGTECALGRICKSGECVRHSSPPPSPSPSPTPPPRPSSGVWSDWKPMGECQSECLVKSRGYQTMRRVCKGAEPNSCTGRDEENVLCKDEKICKKSKRISASDFATKKCSSLQKILPYIDENSSGIQTPHNEEKNWTSCAIFCRKKQSGEYFAPRVDMRGSTYSAEDLYFPDGTWCYGDGKLQYYCQNHECTPESKPTKSAKSRRGDPLATLFDDYNLMDNALNPEPLDYETLQDNQPFDMEKGVEVHDYIELPQ
ncbi:A disintegrin and metalloproteinase with thrombospondin motifs adt-1-like, partial [Diaphorina citri]|uniref:A disintegrin and metalloproteinase with thrombospondin motifs adt-1-like n=1 Tax=Diaphorina citri TaxID=121845 RepID=A0A3Q0ILD4_DIACI